jgi:MFS family permease
VLRRFRELSGPLGTRDFRLAWIAQLASELGDWAARLALAVVVLDRTDSALLAGLVTTLSVLPWVGIGQVLATMGDRFPRRSVLIAADLVRALVFAVMVLPLPIPVLLGLTFVAGLATPPFQAARSALLPEILPEDRYGDGLALAQVTGNTAVLLGYLSGGGLVALVGGRSALLLNAATFLVSALALAAMHGGRERRSTKNVAVQLRAAFEAMRDDVLVFRAAAMVALTSLGAIAAEALVVAYVDAEAGGRASVAGVLAATVPLGTIAGASLVPRKGDHARLLRVAALLGLAGSVVAGLGFFARPDMPLAIVPYLATGLVFAVIVPANVVVGARVPPELRASVFGYLQGSLMACTALGAAGGGLLAEIVGVGPACAFALLPGLGYAVVVLVRAPAEVAREPASAAA